MTKLDMPQKISQYFNLKNTDLDFLDIYTDRDISLFLDPFGISAMRTPWSRECESQIATYFQYLIDSIRNGNKKTVKQLLNALHEVDEIGLGYSLNSTKGRGIGPVQAIDIQQAFENSQAAKSGDIKDIADCALLIPGINRDKISDITANILKKQLITFTQEQCRIHGIEMKKNIPVNNVFDYENFEFVSFYADLPVVNGKPKILLPLRSVRRKPQLSKDKYYRNFVLEFLRAEHQHAADSLAIVLKNGDVKVRIQDLKAKYPMNVDFLYDFSKKHPGILDKFKTELRRTAHNENEEPSLKTKRKIYSPKERIEILSKIKVGSNDATVFHNFSFDNLIYILGNRVTNPVREKEIHEGRKRVDIVFDNNNKGAFNKLNNLYKILCPKIFFECKNYGQEIGNPEIDQLQGRFSIRRGQFGIIVCRSIENKQTMIKRCKDVLNDSRGFILVIDDKDIVQLLQYKANKNENAIDNFFIQKFSELVM